MVIIASYNFIDTFGLQPPKKLQQSLPIVSQRNNSFSLLYADNNVHSCIHHDYNAWTFCYKI